MKTDLLMLCVMYEDKNYVICDKTLTACSMTIALDCMQAITGCVKIKRPNTKIAISQKCVNIFKPNFALLFNT